MTQRNLSTRAVESGNDSETGEVWLILLTIIHPDILDGPLRLVNDHAELQRHVLVNGASTLVTHIALPFDIDLPGENPDSPSKAVLKVDNVDRRIVQAMRELQSPPTVDIEVVLKSQPDVTEVSFPGMTLRNVRYDVNAVSGDLSFESIYGEPVSIIITPHRFPGLF